jgi:hypothetical protein
MNILPQAFPVVLALCAVAHSQERISLSPYEIATENSPFLQEAFPQRTEVVRSVLARGDYDLVHYQVRIFPDPSNRHEFSLCNFAWVVSNAENQILSTSMLKASFPTTRPPDKQEFLTFDFTVRSSLEKTTTINVGRNKGMRTYYTSYRLPLQSVKTTAEQAGTGQPATRPESKSEGGDKPQPEADGRSR